LLLLLFPLHALAGKGNESKSKTGGKGGMAPKVFRPEGLPSPITPNPQFYIEDISGPPEKDPHLLDHWRLDLMGTVDHPLSLSYKDILHIPSVKQVITLSCIGNPIGGHAIGTAEWEGVLLKDLLEKADPDFLSRTMIFRGADGYHDSLPLKKGYHRGAMLAYKMNGRILSREHGYPLRLLVPGFYGIKQLKWIREIEVTDQDHQGYWQKRKWTPEGKVQLLSRIDSHTDDEWLFSRETVFRGIAFSGDRGIQYVQVSLDGERTWQLARLEPPLSDFSWVFWSFPCKFTRPGRYTVSVRAADQFSGIQMNDRRDPFPAGTRGFHRIKVNVA